MKMTALLAVSFLLAAGASSAQTTLQWTPGWNNLKQQLDFVHSNVTWVVTPESKLGARYKLISATPNRLYQVGVHIFCTTFPATFGQFPVHSSVGGGNCESDTAQGVTETLVAVELGVVLTDVSGNGALQVIVGPIAPGTYYLEFDARNGAGCDLVGGGPCDVDFQSPGPTFGDATTITVP